MGFIGNAMDSLFGHSRRTPPTTKSLPSGSRSSIISGHGARKPGGVAVRGGGASREEPTKKPTLGSPGPTLGGGSKGGTSNKKPTKKKPTTGGTSRKPTLGGTSRKPTLGYKRMSLIGKS